MRARTRWLIATGLILLVVGLLLFSQPWPDDDRTPRQPGTEASLHDEEEAWMGSDTSSLHTESLSVAELESSGCLMSAVNTTWGAYAVVTSRIDGANRYFVFGPDGVLYEGHLPFSADRIALGISSNNVTVGFANLRLNAKVARPAEGPEPVAIFHNGVLVHLSDKALDMDVSSDGSAFYVVEPTVGDTSRLIVRSFDSGTQAEFDLDTAAYGEEWPYTLSFASDDKSIILQPNDGVVDRTVHFFPTDGLPEKSITPPDNPLAVATVFASTTTAFQAAQLSENQYRIDRLDFATPGAESTPATWSRDIDLEHFYGQMQLSDDGDWLVLQAWLLLVLDSSTGATVFTWPIADKRAEAERLSGVANAEEGEIGAVTGASIVDGHLLLSRKIGLEAAQHCHEAVDIQACIDEAKQKIREVVDVVPLADVQIEGKPSERIDMQHLAPCTRRNLHFVDIVDTPSGIKTSAEPRP